MLRSLIVAAATLTACASGGSGAPAAAPAPAQAAPAAAPARVAGPAAPAPVNPVGSFEFATEVNGSPMKGTLSIAGSPGAYSGKIASDVLPEMPITSVTVDGQLMKLVADTPNGAVTVSLAFTGVNFTGNWELAGQSGSMAGKRTK
ncbi:MAG: hypothetical protein HYX65_12465 [Gemmatimonadetes bacterium]|nr:hypothetical protein [Gemmatimonadota bacterium]